MAHALWLRALTTRRVIGVVPLVEGRGLRIAVDASPIFALYLPQLFALVVGGFCILHPLSIYLLPRLELLRRHREPTNQGEQQVYESGGPGLK